MKSYIVAISGASGSIYGIRLLEELLHHSEKIHLCISPQAFLILKTETGIDWSGKTPVSIEKKIQKYYASKNIHFYSNNNLAAPIASGSFPAGGMFVVPCSMKTLAGIANGYAANLIERAADVTLKEGRKLILSPREMPFSAIHLENMLKLSRIGVTIAPPVPAFYQKPRNINDIVDFVIGKILDSAGLSHNLFTRWK